MSKPLEPDCCPISPDIDDTHRNGGNTRRNGDAKPVRIGIVIPAWNEESRIGDTVEQLRRQGEPARIVVADCNSDDNTAAVARSAGATVLTGVKCRCRATAMNAGAWWMLGIDPTIDVVWFVHADTTAPLRWDRCIQRALASPGVIGGAFEFCFDEQNASKSDQWKLAFIAWTNRFRYRLTRRFFGDQGIFVRRWAFQAVGGYPLRDLLEDVGFCERVSRLGALRLIPESMGTSARRFVARGVLRHYIACLAVLAADGFDFKPRSLWRWYNRE